MLCSCTSLLVRSSWERSGSVVERLDGLDAINKVLLRFKSACSATVTSWKTKISLEANSDMILSKRRITKAQIGPRRSAPLLVAPSAPKTTFLALRTLS